MKCPECGGSGVNQDRFLDEGEARGMCWHCNGTGQVPAEAPESGERNGLVETLRSHSVMARQSNDPAMGYWWDRVADSIERDGECETALRELVEAARLLLDELTEHESRERVVVVRYSERLDRNVDLSSHARPILTRAEALLPKEAPK